MSSASHSFAASEGGISRARLQRRTTVRPAVRSANVAYWLSVFCLALALVVFAVAAVYQLQLPGLHYDEAKEAGVNAMQLLTGQPVTAFRDATIAVGRWRVPLMVQDYIGNLNVLLAVPFLAIGGVNTIALRALPLFLAALTLILTWKIAGRLGGPVAAAASALLLAVNPSFVFWSRQGIFVTNITALLFVASLWFGILWWERRRPLHLILTAFFCGLGIYAKLLFVWAAIALFVAGVVALLWERRKRSRAPLTGEPGEHTGSSTWLPKPSTLALAAVAFVLPLTPLILFNLRTGGTFTSIFGNLGRSYYGVDNSAYGSNLLARLGQILSLLRGDQFWYLGEINANQFASWLLLSLVVLAALAWRSRRRNGERAFFTPALPLALLTLIVMQSAFTVSDLFITHFALVTPLVPLTAGLALSEVVWWARGRESTRLAAGALTAVGVLLVAGWGASDARSVVRYHRALTISGGFSAHSDAVYRLAEYLDQKGYRSPVALDWGIDAPVRFLTQGQVQPVDVFGYDRLDAPDDGFMERLAPYLETWETVFIAHAPTNVVFKGRVEAIEALSAAAGTSWMEEIRFGQRSGDWVFTIDRYLPLD